MQRRVRRVSGVVALFAALGCQDRKEPDRVPSPRSQVAPSAAAAPSSALPAPLGFHVVARFKEAPSLHKVDGALFVSVSNWLARLENAELVVDDSLKALIPRGSPAWFGFQLSGTWPDQTVAAATFPDDMNNSLILQHTEKGWQSVGNVRRTSLLSASLWGEGRVLALTYPGGNSAGALFATRFRSWPPSPELPRLSPAPKTDGTDDTEADVCAMVKTAIVPAAMLTDREGRVFVAGATCQKRHLAVEWFTPGKKDSQSQILAETEDRGPSGFFTVRGPNDLYLGLGSSKGSVLSHFDGQSWKTVQTPFTGYIFALDVTADGNLFVVARPVPYRLRQPFEDKFAVRPEDEAQLWQRSPQGTWTRIPLPQDIPMLHDRSLGGAHSVAAATSTDVWLSAGTALLHTAPPRGGVRQFKTQE